MKNMPKKTSSVLQKVSSFMKLAKLRNPISFNLIFLKKKSGKFKFYSHYNYGYIQAYQFSPSNDDSPLFFTNKKEFFSNVRRNKKGLQSMLFMCLCLGKFGVEEREEIYSSMELLPPIEYGVNRSLNSKEEEVEKLEIDDGDYGLMSVDERAEKFIEKFYAQMKMQGQETSSSNTVSLLLSD